MLHDLADHYGFRVTFVCCGTLFIVTCYQLHVKDKLFEIEFDLCWPISNITNFVCHTVI